MSAGERRARAAGAHQPVLGFPCFLGRDVYDGLDGASSVLGAAR